MLEILLYSLSGLFMKVSDDAHDQKHNTILGIVAAVICGVTIGYLAVTSADAACIFLAILIGTVAAWKVDCLNHILSLLIFVGIIIVLGFPTIGIVTLAVCAVAAFLDEIGNDSKWAAEQRYVKEFFQYRFALKIVILIFAVLGMLTTIYPELQIAGIQFFTPLTFVYFLAFELSYELVGLKFNAIYDRAESLLGVIRGVDRSAND
ncbi:MAG: hypothetical protein HVN34_00460 [Methanobacteriaceae archaeon]|jgi:hypothetical protein|nr:hypothetical protein [Methanobacteriaceae archaeon]OPY24266.1 MAG: hypothetical protein A4E26_00412 [Methanobacterium sp. PtaU1.Bin097]